MLLDHPPKKIKKEKIIFEIIFASMLLSALVHRFSVSHMQGFFSVSQKFVRLKVKKTHSDMMIDNSNKASRCTKSNTKNTEPF